MSLSLFLFCFTPPTDEAKQASEYLNRDIIKEEYKAKHGHYPH